MPLLFEKLYPNTKKKNRVKQIWEMLITIIGASYVTFHLYLFILPWFSQLKNKKCTKYLKNRYNDNRKMSDNS